MYRGCYIGPLKCGTWALTQEWALARDTMVFVTELAIMGLLQHPEFHTSYATGIFSADIILNSPRKYSKISKQFWSTIGLKFNRTIIDWREDHFSAHVIAGNFWRDF